MVLRVSRGLLSPYLYFGFSQDLHLRRGIADHASFCFGLIVLLLTLCIIKKRIMKRYVFEMFRVVMLSSLMVPMVSCENEIDDKSAQGI